MAEYQKNKSERSALAYCFASGEIEIGSAAPRGAIAIAIARGPRDALTRMIKTLARHLGVSVENQRAADERIPHLLETPAAVRFLSCEPLLGPVDLIGWGSATADQPQAAVTTWGEFAWPDWVQAAVTTWGEFAWPDWVPLESRKLIEDFWRVEYGRGPLSWIRDNYSQRTPGTGKYVGVKMTEKSKVWGQVCPLDDPYATHRGRFLHLWNNIGRVVCDDGQSIAVSASRGVLWLSKWPDSRGEYHLKLHQIIGGGESGPGARPMHPEWARSLRDQCAAAGVPYFHKHNGEWEVIYDRNRDDPDWRRCPQAKDNRERYVNYAGGQGFHGERVVFMRRTGKHAAGRLLDGIEHNELPTITGA